MGMPKLHTALAGMLAATLTAGGCAKQRSAAEEVYVAPGELDTHYAFLSGGHSGQVYVYGLPSGRLLNEIPVFSPYPRTGYGYDEESKRMMGKFTWGDAHHPGLSETKGDYDGRWLFIQDNPNSRLARINLKTFETEEILGPIPNISGLHAGPWLSPNTEYLFGATRFSVPIPLGTSRPLTDYKKPPGQGYDGCLVAVKVDPTSGHMTTAFQVRMPPMHFDIADSGKGPSEGWTFFTSYNTELATTKLEVNASQHDLDFVAAFNWKAAEKAIANGQFTTIDGVKVIDPTKTPGIVYFLPAPKSPHGVDVSPDGRWIVAAGKLVPAAIVLDWQKIQESIAKKDFDGAWRGIPVLRYETINAAEVPVGLGPLHTQFDDKGNAYTSLFIDSAVCKWHLGDWKVLDKIPVTYNVGHLAAGDTVHPKGKYLLSLNKITKDRFLGTGPSYPTNAQLIDISGEKMRLLSDFPTLGEPHYAQIIPADMIKPMPIFDLAKNTSPGAVKTEKATGVTRQGNRVDIKMSAIRTHLTPDNITVKAGDTVIFHVTNLEQDENIAHGFAINWSNVNLEIPPGATRSAVWKADKRGVYPFYCTNFCSALHQEMQGWIVVE
jgi:nitrous-oxide reductase